MHGIDATGLVKIDLLGNRALAVIADVCQQAGAHEADIRPADTTRLMR